MIGDIIRRARKKRGLSQEQLGKLLGISDVMVCKIETGAKAMPLDRKDDFCRALGIVRLRVKCHTCGGVS